MSTLARRVGLALRRHQLVDDGDRVAVAVSGGSDSVALTWLLHELSRRAVWSLAGLIHVHHGLRGADADADEAFCRALAVQLNLPFDVTHVDVATRARAARESIEAAARRARYQVFVAASARLGATRVATGHTLDDQAETVMMRLLRGATARGLGAVRRQQGLVIRPLLDCRREELRAELARRGQPFRDDASNADLSITRNRVRHRVMPTLDEFGPGAVIALARFAALSVDDEGHLSRLARQAATVVRVPHAARDGVQLDRATLQALPWAIARRVVRDALEDVGATVSRRYVESVLVLALGVRRSGHVDLRGIIVDLQPAVVCLSVRISEPKRSLPFELALAVPGTVEIPETPGRIEASYREVGHSLSGVGGPVAMLSASAVPLPLLVRSRRPGDRFRPLGAPGSRKLQDVLIDRKVPREARDRLPIVTDATGRIVWVAGVEVADHCRVTTPEGGVVILEFTALGKGYQ